ncbi:MAG: hypothetical protein HOY71_00370 [Nonomuraea sp.]|nr:hypothetical protein [Nonomuraea sp.]
MKTLISLAVAAVLLVAIGAAQRLIPDPDTTYAPMAAKGAIGQEVRSLPYSVRVERARTGRELLLKKPFLDTAEKKTTKGVWVVVDLTATAAKEEVRLGEVELRATDGTRYAATDRFQGFDQAELQAGIPANGQIAFELPADAVSGAELWITNPHYQSIHRRDDALGSAVEIDLALSGAPEPTVTVKEKDL